MSTSGSVGLKRGFRGLERCLIELACVNHTRKPIRAAELDVVMSTSFGGCERASERNTLSFIGLLTKTLTNVFFFLH